MMQASSADVVLVSRDAQLAEQVARRRPEGLSLSCLTPDEFRALPLPRAANWWIDLESARELATLASGKRVYFYSRVPNAPETLPPGHFVRKPCPGPLLSVLWAGIVSSPHGQQGGGGEFAAASSEARSSGFVAEAMHGAAAATTAVAVGEAAAPGEALRLPAWITDFHGIELRELADRVTRTLPVRLGAKFASLYLTTQRNDALTLAESSYPSAVELTIPLAETPPHAVAAAIRGGRGLLCADIAALSAARGWAEPRWAGPTRILPLRVERETVGAIVLIDRADSAAALTDCGETPGVPTAEECAIADFIARGLRLARLYELARTEARTDPLTGLLNARSLHEHLEREIVRAARYSTPLSLVAVDLDGLKQFNDEFGHPAGDALLRHVAGRLRTALRQIDLAARVGGDEFLALLPATDIGGARHVAERIDAAVRNDPPTIAGQTHPVSVSVGVAPWQSGWNSQDFIAAADRAMYAVKRTCRARQSLVAG